MFKIFFDSYTGSCLSTIKSGTTHDNYLNINYFNFLIMCGFVKRGNTSDSISWKAEQFANWKDSIKKIAE